jgi:hypothetical protein
MVATRRRRILLGQLGAAGDCVYATTVARQIKADLPGCHLTWAIGSAYRQVIAHNPHVDDVWEVELQGHRHMVDAWRAFVSEARRRQLAGDFDEIHLTQIYPDNLQNFDGTVRASIFRGYPRPITVPITPVIRLSEDEIEHVRTFAMRHGLEPAGRAILFEASPRSGQSAMDESWLSVIATRLTRALPEWRVISASPRSDEQPAIDIIDASGLGFREIAELARYCSLFVGCSSGLTWLLTSDAAPHGLPMIQLLSKRAGEYGAVVHDLEHWRLPSDHVIELREGGPERAAECVIDVLSHGIAAARNRHHQELPPRFDFYLDMIIRKLRQGDLSTFRRSLGHAIARYGFWAVVVTGLSFRITSELTRRIFRLQRSA